MPSSNPRRRRLFAIVSLIVVASGSSSGAQDLCLSLTRIRVGGWFELHTCAGTPGAEYVVACDSNPGPTQVAGIGTVALGLSPAMIVSPVFLLDAGGAGMFSWPVDMNPVITGGLLHFQAAGVSPTAPSGYALSSGKTAPIHAEEPEPGVVTTLTLGDDDAVVVPFGAGFFFTFYGVDYHAAGVSSNGLITFGGTDTNPTEGAAAFVYGLPKIALLWDDLTPPQGGEVRVSATATTLTVSIEGVPQFWQPGPNVASVTLYSDGRLFFSWTSLALADGLVGISPGGGLTLNTQIDFTASCFGGPASLFAFYERFLPPSHNNDLNGQAITFIPAGDFGYRWVRLKARRRSTSRHTIDTPMPPTSARRRLSLRPS